MTNPTLIALIAGYLIGSIPFGILVARSMGLGNLRKIGSGNIGATNVLRTGNKTAAAATLVLDMGKGALAVLAMRYLFDDVAALFAGAGAFLGHIFPIWLRFRGGKGVATFLGVALAVNWQVGLIACATWLIAAYLGRISSLSALVSSLIAPLWFYLLGGSAAATLGIVLAFLIWVKHHENIARLLCGREPLIGKT